MKIFIQTTLTLFIIWLIFMAGDFFGQWRKSEEVLVRCLASSSQWYPYPQLCRYYVGLSPFKTQAEIQEERGIHAN